MEYIILYKYNTTKNSDWFILSGCQGIKKEKTAISLRDCFADMNPDKTYTIVSLLNEDNLEVVK